MQSQPLETLSTSFPNPPLLHIATSLNPSFCSKRVNNLILLCQRHPPPASTFLGFELISESGYQRNAGLVSQCLSNCVRQKFQ
ncbi:hypothetical protein GLYMA_20G120400v4 [Glycine max]|uniref:Uncharacterized protein n=2 Tax=Glycine subgen. Soja TaxID=1462606 RepID=A0A0R0EBF5_SOYBN|nr:hypothetical protein JHK87_056281 [Glycine soja]KAH1035712.1 hypothetical protein GYH30_055608 [Glycine max]KRG90896.1 hypothetical protein GLYMA_20G120400v4 [Glycine max]RZB43520.1 hypothetical protein D0Y65_053872 [Glycine soja]